MLMVGVLTYHSFFFFFFFFMRNSPIIQGRVMFQKKNACGWSFDPSFKVQWCSKKNAYGWSFDPSFKVQWCLSSGALLKVVYRLLHPHSIRHVIVNIDYHVSRFILDEGWQYCDGIFFYFVCWKNACKRMW